MTISSTNTKNSYSGDGTTVAFSYTFKILDDDDIQVILRTDATGTETVQTKTTDYTVSGVGNAGGGTITFVSAPAATETVVLLRNVPLTQTTDYTPNDPFPAATHEDALDKLTLMAQDTQEEVDRSIKLSRTNTMTSTEFTVGATTRANKIFAFDSSGELAVTQEIGTFQGDWAASTAYAERDLVKDTSTNNIFIVNSAHTSSGSQPLTTNPNSSKYDLIVDAAAATTSATNAASSATAAAASATAAAASESAAATSETNAAASEAGVAADAAAAAASAASASTSATNASTSETNASNSASAAATSATNAATSATNASNSASAAGTSESNAATSATNASNSASAAATSASNAATSESNASTSETNAASSASSAASDASAAATSAAAAAASFDAFDDIYLGAKASAPTVDNDGDALTEGDQYFNTTNNTLFVWNGSAWQAASPDIVGDTTPQLGGDLDTNGNDINFGDNDKAIFGAGSDLQVFHDATDSHVVTTNGDLNLQVAGAGTINLGDQFGNTLLKVVDNADVKLYHGTTPSEKLATTSSGIDVTGTSKSDLVVVDSTGGATPTYSHTNNGEGITLRYNDDSGARAADIVAIGNNPAGATMAMRFFVNPNSTDAASEVMRIQNGNVGIGTSSPSGKAEIYKSSVNSAIIGTSYNGHYFESQSDDATDGFEIYQKHGSNTTRNSFIVNDNRTGSKSAAFLVRGDGNVGIGTSGPSTTLQVGDGSADTRSTFNPSSAFAIAVKNGANHGGFIGSNGSSGMQFSSSGGANRMVIDSSGNVGIGTNTPVNTLDVIDNGGGAAVVGRIRNEGGAAGDDATLELSIATASEEMRVLFTDSAGTAGQIVVDGGDNSMAFETGTSEAMRIDSSGNVLVADTTNVGTADHKVSIQKGSAGRCLGLGTTVTTATVMMSLVNGNGTVGTIQTNGTATSYVTSSDHRLKENVADMTGAIDRVKALAPKRFNFIADADTTVDGFLAHEAQTVVPEAVTGTHNEVDEDGNAVMQGIDQSKLVPLLTGALQEAIAKIETLETQRADLEARLTALEGA